MKAVHFAVTALVAACLLSACGGGGSSNSSNSATPSSTNSTAGALPPGLSPGASSIVQSNNVNIFLTTSIDANPTYNAYFAVLASGEYYGLALTRGLTPEILVHGSFSTSTGPNLFSTNLTSYNLQTNKALTGGTLSVDYSKPQSPVFKALADGASVSFTTNGVATDVSGLHPTISTPLTPAQMAGTFTGSVYASGMTLAKTPASGTLGSDGSLTLQVGSCQANLNLTNATTPGIVNVSMNIAGPNCDLSGVTGAGIAIPANYSIPTQGTVNHMQLNLLLLTRSADKAFTIVLNR